MNVQSQIIHLKDEFTKQIRNSQTSADIEVLRIRYLGKKGPIQDLLKTLKDLPAEERRSIGKEINDLKEEVEQAIEKQAKIALEKEEKQQLSLEKIDISLPGRRRSLGSKHLITHVIDEILNILMGMGFSVQCGPDIETDYYNFEALNFPPNHPARDMQDTFYINDEYLLRTHTTNIQMRLMEMQKPPIRVVAPGKVYRNEDVTARSHVFFHQIDGFYIDKGVTFSDLLATMEEFLRKLFPQNIEVRYRPSYFPFVEPGMEVDVTCLVCEGKGCAICKHSGWLEIAGAGMIHPEVLKNGGVDPEEYTGYAWGMGVDRLVMIKHGIKDIRIFTQNDIRFLSQFPSI